MRINEILLEDTNPHSGTFERNQEAAINAAAFIKKNCQPWLAQTSNGMAMVFRGVQAAAKLARKPTTFIEPVRTNRKPLNTDSDRHRIFNILIDKVGGVANRSNAIFCTSSQMEARFYGPVYIVLPMGPFHYTWSPEWLDWTMNLDMASLVTLANPGTDGPGLLDPNNWDAEKLSKYIKVDQGLDEAIKKKREIMISCNSAFYVDVSFYTSQVLPLLQK